MASHKVTGKQCEFLLLVLILAYFALTPKLVDMPLCPLAYLGCPCPTCGTTRSIWHVFHGQFAMASSLNPIGFLVAFVLLRRVVVLTVARRSIVRFFDNEALNAALMAAFLLLGFWQLASRP